jgi:hypothetical protein
MIFDYNAWFCAGIVVVVVVVVTVAAAVVTVLTYISGLSTSSKKYVPEYTTLYPLDTVTFIFRNSRTKVNVMRFPVVCCFISTCEIYFKKIFI